MKPLLKALSLIFVAGVASAGNQAPITVHVDITENGNPLAKISRTVMPGEPIEACVGSLVVYPKDINISNPKKCEGMAVSIAPMSPSQESLEIHYTVEYYKKSSRISTVDSRLPIFEGGRFNSTSTIKRGSTIEGVNGNLRMSLSAEF